MPSFGVRAGMRQAEFRTHSATISERGRRPSDSKGERHGHLLAHDHEQENLYPGLRGADGAVRFFLERGIKWHRTSRSGDRRGGDGPTRNLASSQVACANFLLPLSEIPGALRAVARAIDEDVEEVASIHDQGRSSPIEFEWFGVDYPLEEGAPRIRGAQNTSIDAFMVAATRTGRRAYLMEWKYVEDYKVGEYKGKGSQGETRRRRYGPLYADDSSSFDPRVPMDEFLYEPFYQIMRLRLLADRMVRRRELDVVDAKVVVVVPEDNAAYRARITSPPLAQRFPELATVEDVVKAALRRPGGFVTVDPSTLVDAVERDCGGASSEWVAYQRERYGA